MPGRKRNKMTLVKAQAELCPLTERVLTQMGPEGDNIRRSLKSFYKNRTRQEPASEEVLEQNS